MKLWTAWLSVVLLNASTCAGVNNNITRALSMSPWFREPANKDQITFNSLLKVTPGITMLECAYRCTAIDVCVSFFYVRPKKTCRMHTGTFAIGAPPPDVISEPETDFYANKCNHAGFQLLAPNHAKYFSTSITTHGESIVAARELCVKNGGTLFTAEDDVEYVMLVDKLADQGWTESHAFWVDASRQSSSSPYLWSDGRPINASHWSADEPMDDLEKNCVLLLPGEGLGNIQCVYGAGINKLYPLCQCFL